MLCVVPDKDNERVAFTASIAEPSIPANSGGVIRFSHTVTNIGGAYDSHTGAFTAPYDGDYMFIVSVDVSKTYARLSVKRNGHTVAEGHNDAESSEHIVACSVVTLTSGDKVTVNHGSNVIGIVDGGLESIFAGFRIR